MRFRIEHEFDADVPTLERVVLDPAFVTMLPGAMPMIAEVRVLARRDVGGAVLEREERFRPSVRPPSFAGRVKPEMLEWVQHTRWDRAAHGGAWHIEPNIPPEWRQYFDGRGIYQLEPRANDRAARVVEGSVEIRVPLVRALAERYAVSQLRAQFDGEARLLARLVAPATP